jgi:hypothetical protein
VNSHIYLFAGALALLSPPASAQEGIQDLPASARDGFDMPGGDYANFPASSATVCMDTCGGESRCRGWTWVKPGLQGAAGHCWLKFQTPLPRLIRNDCCASGSHQNIKAADLAAAEFGTDRPGSNYTNFDTNRWQDCQATCASQSRCQSWTFQHPDTGAGRPSGLCWLKTVVARPVWDGHVVSGVKWRGQAETVDAGH